MLEDKLIDIEIKRQNVNHYKLKGYNCKVGDIITIHTSELPFGSKIKVTVICDYCQKEVKIPYRDYMVSMKSVVKKYSCSHCKGLKIKESNLITYGVDSVMKLKNIKAKLQNTMMDRYGVRLPAQSPEVINKMKNTMIEKYGVSNSMFLDEIKQKIDQTNLKRYGVKSPLQNQNVKNKLKQTCLDRYGVDNPMKIKEIQEKVMEDGNKTKYHNNSIMTSRQQRHINNLINGILNYPIGIYCLDIAFPDKKIYIEYNGSGHDICKRTRNISDKEFHEKEIRRFYYLKSLGWKEILITSSKDYLIKDDKFKDIINNSINILKTTDSYQQIVDIDTYDILGLYKLKSSTD